MNDSTIEELENQPIDTLVLFYIVYFFKPTLLH